MDVKLTKEELQAFLDSKFLAGSEHLIVEDMRPMQIDVRLPTGDQHRRPGGTISGPTMFTLADAAMYLVTLGMIGLKTLAVTTNCSIDFMRKPAVGRDLIATAQILKLGKALVVGDVLIHSEGEPAPVARASLTYSIPPAKVAEPA